jgi:hypothetical protein
MGIILKCINHDKLAICTFAPISKVRVAIVFVGAVAEVTYAIARVYALAVIAAASIQICFLAGNIACLVAHYPVQDHWDTTIVFIPEQCRVKICCSKMECSSLHHYSIATVLCTICGASVGVVIRSVVPFIEINVIVGHVAGERNLAAAVAIAKPISGREVFGSCPTPKHILHNKNITVYCQTKKLPAMVLKY